MSKRPGTVDYSKFDNLDFSDDSSEDENDERSYYMGEENFCTDGDEYDDDDDDEELSYESKESCESDSSESDAPLSMKDQRRRRPPPMTEASLATLQRAWGAKVNVKANIIEAERDEGQKKAAVDDGGAGRTCASCRAPSPPFRCSRCKLVWFCNVRCQSTYHPVHKKECVDADKHMKYWGFLTNDSSKSEAGKGGPKSSKEDDRAALQSALEARVSLRRRRALKRAAAVEAVERARLAREARGDAKGPVKGKGAEKEETCPVCQCEFTVSGDSGIGLCCPSSHHMCSECTGVYVKSVLGDLEASYPPRCPMCRGDFPLDQFESQLGTKQQAHVRAFAAQRALKPSQCLIKCPKCEYFEVQKKPGDCIWWCGSCGEGTCFVCNADLPANVKKYDIEKSPHALCLKLRFSKAKIEEAIEKGSKMECPSCGLAGRKDDACTHMSCPKCTTTWCYICGLSAPDCDKAPPREEGRPVDDIFLHNQDWETNELRCPMYMTQVLEVDLNWLGEDWEQRAQDADFEDDDKCLDYFHRFRTIKKLQEVRSEIGPGNFASAFVHFDSIKNSGYAIDEVVNTCTDKLIDRTEYLQYHKKIKNLVLGLPLVLPGGETVLKAMGSQKASTRWEILSSKSC